MAASHQEMIYATTNLTIKKDQEGNIFIEPCPAVISNSLPVIKITANIDRLTVTAQEGIFTPIAIEGKGGFVAFAIPPLAR